MKQKNIATKKILNHICVHYHQHYDQQCHNHRLANRYSCLTHRIVDVESAGPAIEGMIHQRMIFLFIYIEMSLGLFLDLMDHPLAASPHKKAEVSRYSRENGGGFIESVHNMTIITPFRVILR